MTNNSKNIKLVAALTDNGLSLVINGEPSTINEDHINFKKILKALREREYHVIPAMIDVAKGVEDYCKGLVTIKHGSVYFGDTIMDNSLTRRMMQMINLGIDISHYAKFLERLQKNPSNHSVTQLYNFMEACDLPITEDGRLLAYKSVNDDYLDTHTRTIDNSVGKVIEMPRNMVNDNPDQTCSHGLHVCSQKYGMYGSRLLMVAVDPADVVSVPRDYNSAKMRVCKYEVLKDVQHRGFETFEDTPVWYDDMYDDGEYYE